VTKFRHIFRPKFSHIHISCQRTALESHEKIGSKRRQNELASSNVTQPSKRQKVEIYDMKSNDGDFSPILRKDLVDSLQFAQIDDRFLNISLNYGNTCKWLLQTPEFLAWLDPNKLREHNGFFWIKGKPGCGKSTLMKFLFGEVKRSLGNSILLSFFFNARGDELEKSTIGLYRSLLVQILKYCPQDEQIWDIPGLSHRIQNEQLKYSSALLKQLLTQIIQSLEGQNITIMVDALDECDDVEVRDMTAFFEQFGEDFVSSGREFRVIFASRHYPHITIESCIPMTLEDQQGHYQDIDKYLSKKLKIGRSADAERLRQEIREKAFGIFMWIILVVKILNEEADHGQVHMLRKRLQDIPKDLHQLFQSILTRDSKHIDNMKLCLQWTLYARRPMTPEELYVAIMSGLEHDVLFPHETEKDTMKLFILSSSKGLVEVTRTKIPTVQFIHESVRDFLLKENGLGQLWPDLKVNAAGISHDRLRQCCSNFLRPDIASDLNAPDSRSSKRSRPGANVRNHALLKFPFLKYAIRHIFAHADNAQAAGVSQDRFLKECDLKIWVQLYNIVEKFQTRRLRADVDLLYVVAERECPNLVEVLVKDNSFPLRRSGRFGNPVFAAIAADNYPTFELLVEPYRQMHPDGCVFPWPSTNVASFLAEHGKPGLIYRFLSIFNIDINISKSSIHPTLLFWAVWNGYEKIVELLLRRGADVNKHISYTGPVLQVAAAKGHVGIVRMLLNHGARVNHENERFASVLQAAASNGTVEMINLLLDHGAIVNMEKNTERSALQLAAGRGNQPVVELLLQRYADVNAQCDGVESTPLHSASREGHDKIVKLLLERGADVNAQGVLGGTALMKSTPLHSASREGHDKIVKLLLERGADVNAQDAMGSTALMEASQGNHERIVMLLLDRGANIDACSGRCGTALHIASRSSNARLVRLLLNRGANVNINDEELGNALQAASWSRHPEKNVIELLLDWGADINAHGGSDGTALGGAAQKGNIEMVKLLLGRGADVNAKGGKHLTVLQEAVSTNMENKELVRLLLEKGADVNGRGGSLNTVLQGAIVCGHSHALFSRALFSRKAQMYLDGEGHGTAQAAAYRHHEELIMLLLENGADVHTQGGLYNTALQAASCYGSIEVVKQLLNRGADVNARGGMFGNALQAAIAMSNSKEKMTKLLLDQEAHVNARGGKYGTALQAAAHSGSKTILKQLLSLGADVNAQGGQFGTALQAASFAGDITIVRILLEHGANANTPGGQYGNALQAASYVENEMIVKLLLDNGADINAQGGEYCNALHASMARRHTKTVAKLLLDRGADVNSRSRYYGSVLQEAAYIGNEVVVKLLLDKGANVNQQGGKFGNALHAALARDNGNGTIVKLLLDGGADAYARGTRFGSAVEAALSSQWATKNSQLLMRLGIVKGKHHDDAV
jgi:ankyrin repeat protein